MLHSVGVGFAARLTCPSFAKHLAMETNALQILKDHHQQISGLFEMIRNSRDLNEKLTLFQELKDELDLHSVMEEKVLYPVLSTYDEVSDMLDRAYDVHDEISDLVEEIDQMEVGAVEGDIDEGGTYDTTIDEFDDAIDELQGLFIQHCDQNENELYPEVNELLDDDDLVAIGNSMNELRSLGLAA